MASRYFRNTGNTSWSVTTNWSATDGGASVGAIPTTADDVFFTSNSGSCTVNVAGVGLTINFTGYVNTITMTNGITISSNITLASGMTIAGTSAFTASGVCTFVAAGKTVPALVITAASTFTPSGTLNVTTLTLGGCTFSGATGWTAVTCSFPTTGSNTTFVSGTTYNVTGTLQTTGADGGTHMLIKSSTPGSKANINLTGNCNLGYMDCTDINATGRPIYSFNGTITTCTNIFSLVDYIANPIESSF